MEKKTNVAKKEKSANPMREIRVEKVTLNIGAGEAGPKLENSKELLKKLTGRTPTTTLAKIRAPTWHIKPGDPIGTKVTLRGANAETVLKNCLQAKESKVNNRSFDRNGNVSFGVPEYIDVPGAKYDAKIGIMGFDVCVTLSRKGKRVSIRRHAQAMAVGKKHLVTKDEAIAFMKGKFGVEVLE